MTLQVTQQQADTDIAVFCDIGQQGWCFTDLFLYDVVGEHIRVRDDHCYLLPVSRNLVAATADPTTSRHSVRV